MESFANHHPISLPTIMTEHMRKIVSIRDDKHALSMWIVALKTLQSLQIKLEKGTPRTRRHMFKKTTCEEYKCVRREGGVESQYIDFDYISTQERSIIELEKLTSMLAQRDAENANLKAKLQVVFNESSEGSDMVTMLQQENAQLNNKVITLRDQVGDLT